jgi:VIT1/CCC1 family predicted Fe2+/Mn2+ transporter
MIRILTLIMTILPAIISYQMFFNKQMFLNTLEQNDSSKLFLRIFGWLFAVTALLGLVFIVINSKGATIGYIVIVVFVAMAFSLTYSAKIKKKLNS